MTTARYTRVLACTLFAIAFAVFTLGCETGVAVGAGSHGVGVGASMGGHHKAMPPVNQLVAVMHPTEGNATHGHVIFTKVKDGIHVEADIRNLSQNSKHAIHIHEYGDARAANGTSAGGHYNPEGHDHALPHENMRHAGDLGNLESNFDGRATLDLTVHNITLNGVHNAIIGRSVIIHAKEDDGGQPTGNAGPRIAIGVIGVAKP